MKPLKVLQYIEGGNAYGAARAFISTCESLRLRGHTVEVLTVKGRPLGREMRQLGFKVEEFALKSKYAISAYSGLRKLILSGGYDLVHTHLSMATLSGSLSGRWAKVPVVSTVHGMNHKLKYLFSRHLIAVSEAGKENLVKQGVAPRRVSVVYNGIDCPPFESMPSREEARAELGFGDDVLLVGSTSRIHRNKGLGTMIDAIPQILRDHPNAVYVVAGDGKHAEELRQEVEAKGLAGSVRFVGYQQDVFRFLRALDAFVHPTLNEAMGISIVEAMLARVPVVGSDVGGVPEVIRPGTGSLVRPDDPQDLAEAVSRALSGSHAEQIDAAEHLARTAFGYEAMGLALEQAYDRTLSSSKVVESAR